MSLCSHSIPTILVYCALLCALLTTLDKRHRQLSAAPLNNNMALTQSNNTRDLLSKVMLTGTLIGLHHYVAT